MNLTMRKQKSKRDLSTPCSFTKPALTHHMYMCKLFIFFTSVYPLQFPQYPLLPPPKISTPHHRLRNSQTSNYDVVASR